MSARRVIYGGNDTLDLHGFQKEERVPILKTVVKTNQDIQPLTDDIFSKILNSDVTEKYLSASSNVIENYKNRLLQSTFKPEPEGLCDNNDGLSFRAQCQQIIDMVPPDYLPLTTLGFLVIFGLLAYSSSFGLIMGIITICFIIRMSMNALVKSEETSAENEEITKQTMAIKSVQESLSSVALAVKDNSLHFHEKNLETMKKCENMIASARYGQTDAMVSRHQEDIKKVIGLNSKIQTGMTNRTRLRNQTMLTAVSKQSDTHKQVATMDARTDGQVLNSEKVIHSETLSTDSSIAGLRSSTSIKVKRLETDYKSEKARQSAEREIERIEEGKREKIRHERRKTEAVRRRCEEEDW